MASRSLSSVNSDLYTDAALDERVFLLMLISAAVALSCLRPVYTDRCRSSSIAEDESDLVAMMFRKLS